MVMIVARSGNMGNFFKLARWKKLGIF